MVALTLDILLGSPEEFKPRAHPAFPKVVVEIDRDLHAHGFVVQGKVKSDYGGKWKLDERKSVKAPADARAEARAMGERLRKEHGAVTVEIVHGAGAKPQRTRKAAARIGKFKRTLRQRTKAKGALSTISKAAYDAGREASSAQERRRPIAEQIRLAKYAAHKHKLAAEAGHAGHADEARGWRAALAALRHERGSE